MKQTLMTFIAIAFAILLCGCSFIGGTGKLQQSPCACEPDQYYDKSKAIDKQALYSVKRPTQRLAHGRS